MNRTIAAGLGATVLALAVGIFVSNLARSPQYSLKQAFHAVENRDYAEFEKYVDLGAVVDSALDYVIGRAWEEAQARKPAGERVSAGDEAVLRMVQAAKPRFAAQLQEKFAAFIKNGSFNEAQGNEAQGNQVSAHSHDGGRGLASVTRRIEDLTQEPFRFAGVERIQREGSAALVTFRISRPDHADKLFQVKMKDQGGHWRVTEFAGMVPDGN